MQPASSGSAASAAAAARNAADTAAKASDTVASAAAAEMGPGLEVEADMMKPQFDHDESELEALMGSLKPEAEGKPEAEEKSQGAAAKEKGSAGRIKRVATCLRQFPLSL